MNICHVPRKPLSDQPNRKKNMSSSTSILLFMIILLSTTCSWSKKTETIMIVSGNSTILSPNKTFELGFFNLGDLNWYFGIWYFGITPPTYVWVANRDTPLTHLTPASIVLIKNGHLSIIENSGSKTVWDSENDEKGCTFMLLETGNLVLLSCNGNGEDEIVWQSFDFPTDTWLPGMNLTVETPLTNWRSLTDPSMGFFKLELKPPEYGEIELVYNSSYAYWTTGNWTGNAFVGVPEMTIAYIYRFLFFDPYTPMASFGYTEMTLEAGFGPPPLTRFQLDYTGQLRQFTWNPQTSNWNMFWSQPENRCKVYNLCGNFGFCNSRKMKVCECLTGFSPTDEKSWDSGDFSGGCVREGVCSKGDDRFEEVGVVSFDGGTSVLFSGDRRFCEESCLRNCSCIGLHYNANTTLCKNLYGATLNLRNQSSDSTNGDVLYARVGNGGGNRKKNNVKVMVLIGCVSGFLLIFVLIIGVLILLRRQKRDREENGDTIFPVINLKVFTYKELHTSTQGFSEKLGHGGFGAVFKGELSDSSIVAVKRLERPSGGGEKEFRAEVCTIGNIQHVNLVRLIGFCSENSHRLLVYDYMQNGPLSMYLKKNNGPSLSWDVRFRIAIGTARGITYLHEECRDCIIHCDIKPENILLGIDYIPKVSDFGLAKLVGRDFSRVLATMRGTWGYVAPEWISGVAITSKADVYSYGMTLLELISGRRNVETPPSIKGDGADPTGDGGEKWFFPPWAARHIIEGNVAAVMDERLNNDGGYDDVEAERLGLVAIWCIQDDEVARPTMATVVKMLEGVVEVTVPPPPKLLQALVSGDSFRGVGPDSRNTVSSSGRCSQSSMDDNNSLAS